MGKVFFGVLLFVLFVGSSSLFASSEKGSVISSPVVSSESRVLAYLDGKPITFSDVKAYAEQLPNPKYKEMLNSPEGLKKLLNYYIDRQIILQEAKKTVSPKEGSLKAHSTMDKDSAYIIAYLSKEVGEKIKVTKGEIKQLAKKEGISENKAYAELLSQKRRQKFKALMERLRAKHKIKILIK